MEDISIFTDKSITPSEVMLTKALGKTYSVWKKIKEYIYAQYPSAKEEWSYPGAKYGWSFKVKDKKRVIAYFLPRDGFFKVALVFGQKATDAILDSDELSEQIKSQLKSAKVYAEGRGIRIDVANNDILDDIKFLIDTKLSH
jgi:hypothetical protein